MTATGLSPQHGTSAGVVVRRVGRADVHDVALLWEREGLTPSVRGFRNEIARLRRRDPELVLLASADGCPIGALGASFDGRTVVLSRLAVDANVRRRGVGRRLVGGLRQQLDALGVRSGEIVVLDGDRRADGFWHGMAFECSDAACYIVRRRD